MILKHGLDSGLLNLRKIGQIKYLAVDFMSMISKKWVCSAHKDRGRANQLPEKTRPSLVGCARSL
jgi:hypothetical protein